MDTRQYIISQNHSHKYTRDRMQENFSKIKLNGIMDIFPPKSHNRTHHETLNTKSLQEI